MVVSKLSYVTVNPFHSGSWSCSINPNRTGNHSLLLLWTVSAQQAPLPVSARYIQKQDQKALSAPSLDCLCKAGATS